jgi:hypothetical protein
MSRDRRGVEDPSGAPDDQLNGRSEPTRLQKCSWLDPTRCLWPPPEVRLCVRANNPCGVVTPVVLPEGG